MYLLVSLLPLFFVYFYFVSVAAEKLNGNFTRTSTPCTVYYSNENTKVMGTVFSGSLTSCPVKECPDFVDKKKIEFCCLPSITKSSITYSSKESRAACCQQLHPSHCVRDEGYRPCPGFTCHGSFPWVPGPRVYAVEKPPSFFICPPRTDFSTFGSIIETAITWYKSSQSCADPSKSILISATFDNKKPEVFNWCCSVDVTKNLLADPRKVCCALAGYRALDPFNLQTPPCCRKLDNRSPCIVFGALSVCGPLAGSKKTKNLAENLPALAPLRYYYHVDASSQNYYGAPKQLLSCDKSGSKFLYSLQDDIQGNPIEIGLCCSKNIFYADANSMVSDCCITYAKRDSRMYSGVVDSSFYKCSMMNNKSNGFIDTKNNVFVYRACDPASCAKIDGKFGTLTNNATISLFDVSASDVDPISRHYK